MPRSRFLPPDPRVEAPYRLTPALALRLAILGALVLAVFAVLFLRLWALQVLSGSKYLAVANDNRVRTLALPAPRGTIVDRDGRTIVSNTTGESLELWPADLPKTWSAERPELQMLSTVTGLRLAQIEARLSAGKDLPSVPILIQQGLHRDQVDYIREHAAELPGAKVAQSWLRQYPYQSLLAQVLGYVGQISPGEYKALKKQGYAADASIGQAGIEETYDSYLRGRDGSARLTVDSRGVPSSTEKVAVAPQPGDTVQLTIDMNLQRAAEQGLREGIQIAKANHYDNADGAALVALDPRNGAVLAMASNPTFKPSLWESHSTKPLAPLLDSGVAEADNYPALNRATEGAFPPGSTFKPVTALAAMQEGLLTPFTSLLCSSVYTAYKQQFHNYTPSDSWITLPTALAESCDTFFYQVGDLFYRLPPNRGHPLQAWANRLGLGEKTGIDLPGEITGLIPTPEWRCKAFGGPPCDTVDRTWKPGYSIQLAIGQGDVTVTPLQMARLYALLANGGKLVTPHLVQDVETPGAGVVRSFPAPVAKSVGLNPSYLAAVREGLLEATHSSIGTSSGVFGSFPVSVSGKTGTAEHTANGRTEDDAWWCGYAPSDKPTIALCAMIENGGFGGTAAAPAALKVLQRYFGVKSTTITPHVSD